MSNSSNNMAKATLLDLLNRRLSFQLADITSALEKMIEVKEIGYLKNVFTSSGMHIIQINKTKFNEMMAYIKAGNIK